MSKIKGISLGILVAALVIFAFFNSHSIKVKIWGESVLFSSPLWTVVYVSVIIGVILGFLFRGQGKKRKTNQQ